MIGMATMRWLDRAIALAAALGCALVAAAALAQSPGSFSTLSTTGTATLNGAVLACSGSLRITATWTIQRFEA